MLHVGAHWGRGSTFDERTDYHWKARTERHHAGGSNGVKGSAFDEDRFLSLDVTTYVLVIEPEQNGGSNGENGSHSDEDRYPEARTTTSRPGDRAWTKWWEPWGRGSHSDEDRYPEAWTTTSRPGDRAWTKWVPDYYDSTEPSNKPCPMK
ncbi:hypothetical protein COOONC_18451 [Cooperia oncophora]